MRHKSNKDHFPHRYILYIQKTTTLSPSHVQETGSCATFVRHTTQTKILRENDNDEQNQDKQQRNNK